MVVLHLRSQEWSLANCLMFYCPIFLPCIGHPGQTYRNPRRGNLPYSSRFIPRGLLGARTIDSPLHHWDFIIFLPVQLTGILPQGGSNPRPSDHEPGTLLYRHQRGVRLRLRNGTSSGLKHGVSTDGVPTMSMNTGNHELLF